MMEPDRGRAKRIPVKECDQADQVRQPGLAEVYAAEKLPPVKTFESSPPGEREMLRRQSLAAAVEKKQKPTHRIRKNGRLLPES